MNLILDGKPITIPESTEWTSFAALCKGCSDHLSAQDRAIQNIRLDGQEVDHSSPPTDETFLESKKIEITSCLLNDLIQSALQQQYEITNQLHEDFLNFSSDCLLHLPHEGFEKWKNLLQPLKLLVSFIPSILSLNHLFKPSLEEISEETLLARIEQIQETVDGARKAMETQDIVLFSDTLELKIVPWLATYKELISHLIAALKQKSR